MGGAMLLEQNKFVSFDFFVKWITEENGQKEHRNEHPGTSTPLDPEIGSVFWFDFQSLG